MAKNFESNIKRWSLFAPKEAAQLSQLKSSRISFCKAENGELNLKSESGAEVYYLHSEKDPMHEAKKWFSELPLKNVNVIYVFGVGLGYYYEAAWEWLRGDLQRSLIFFEDDLEVIHRLLETDIGTNLLHDHQVTLRYYGESNELNLDAFLCNFSLYEYATSALESYEKFRPVIVNKIKSHIAFFSVLNRATTLEYSLHGVSFFTNYFRNMLYLPQSYLGSSLFGKFKGVPAIICGAGPSLEKNVKQLEHLKDKALIFAGGTALNALGVKGILPHFGVGIDPNPDHFTRLVMNQAFETPFLYRNRMLHEAFRMIHGDKLFITGAGGYNISEWFEKNLGISAADVDEGCNVLNFSLSIAEALGCNPIIFVGVDLAYSQGQSYASGLISHPIHDQKNSFRTKHAFEELLVKKDIYGEPIHTLWKWIAEAIWYSKYASTHLDVTLINATEGGIGFPNVINAPLEVVAQSYLTKTYDFGAIIHGEIQNAQPPPTLTTERIEELMVDLSESLHRCWLHCHAIYSELDSALAESIKGIKLDFEKIWAKKKEIEAELFVEPAYTYFLRVFNDAYLRAYGFEAMRIIFDEGLIPQEEIEFKKIKLDSLRFHFLKQTALINSSLIQETISEHDGMNKAAEEWSKISKEAHVKLAQGSTKLFDYITEERYALDNQSLMINDPEMNLSFNLPFDPNKGKHLEHYPSGTIKLEQFYQDSLLHGPSTFFSEDGKILAKNWFIKGKKQGKFFTYYHSGEPHSIQRFKDGQPDGRQQYFYRDGSPKTILMYKHGQLNGNVLLYFPNGRPERSLEFVNGKRNGIERIWDEKGMIIVEAEYKDDKPLGAARRWHSNGKLAKEVTFDNETGRWIINFWNSNGIAINHEELFEDDYFDKVTKHTGELTGSLDEVFKQINKIVPLLTQKIDNSHPENNQKMDFQKEFNNITEELKHLHAISEELKVESDLNAGNVLEPLWKSPSTQREVEKQLESLKQLMAKEIGNIEKGIKDVVSGLGPKQENPKPPEEDKTDH